jgi:fluoroacetyl-CoA thioesterase
VTAQNQGSESDNPPGDGLVPGLEGRSEVLIDDTHLTTHVGGRGVFSTPSMIYLMETTAHGSVEPHLEPGTTTVGFEVNVRHLAPAEPGQHIEVTSHLREVSGRRLLFDVACRRGDVLIGSGTHRRAVVPARD